MNVWMVKVDSQHSASADTDPVCSGDRWIGANEFGQPGYQSSSPYTHAQRRTFDAQSYDSASGFITHTR
jgi:hypothetical protein